MRRHDRHAFVQRIMYNRKKNIYRGTYYTINRPRCCDIVWRTRDYHHMSKLQLGRFFSHIWCIYVSVLVCARARSRFNIIFLLHVYMRLYTVRLCARVACVNNERMRRGGGGGGNTFIFTRALTAAAQGICKWPQPVFPLLGAGVVVFQVILFNKNKSSSIFIIVILIHRVIMVMYRK